MTKDHPCSASDFPGSWSVSALVCLPPPPPAPRGGASAGHSEPGGRLPPRVSADPRTPFQVPNEMQISCFNRFTGIAFSGRDSSRLHLVSEKGPARTQICSVPGRASHPSRRAAQPGGRQVLRQQAVALATQGSQPPVPRGVRCRCAHASLAGAAVAHLCSAATSAPAFFSSATSRGPCQSSLFSL